VDSATGRLRFIATPAPTRPEVAQVAWSTCLRVVELLRARGLALDAEPEDVDSLAAQQPLLADCAAASMQDIVIIGPRQGKRVLRLRGGPTATDPKTHRPAHGFDVNAARRVSASDRNALERLCRYVLRPPLSHDRLTRLEDGRIKLRLKRAWSDGTTHLIHDPEDLIARLIPLVPPARSHQVRYHGLLSNAAKHRAAVVPAPPKAEPEQLRLFAKSKPTARHAARRIRWAKLMVRVFGFDPLVCQVCEHPMRIVAFVTEPHAIAEALAAHQDGGARRANPARAPPAGQLELPLS
jgi:hypothetical protein